MNKIIATLIAGLFATAAFAQTPAVVKAEHEASKDVAKAEQQELKADAKAIKETVDATADQAIAAKN